MALKSWIHEDRELATDERIFQVYRVRSQSPRTAQYRQFSIMHAGDWVNVVALTPDHQVVLVHQFRHGTAKFSLEIPGGIIDPGETPAEAAARELLEESGYAGDPPITMGTVSPNPALFDNQCHTCLIENCRKIAESKLDQGEDIETLTRPLSDIPLLIASGDISHALVICAFWHLEHRRQP
jgi:8-oxo-dGTP pyrophosphatase MutT (NUDIX family)